MSAESLLEIRDADGSWLRFELLRWNPYELIYLVSIDVSWAQAAVEVSTYHCGPPAEFFRSLADAWRGWEGEKCWEDIEHRLSFRAKTDRTGHITLRVGLRDATFTGRVELPLYLEAGSLEGIAKSIDSFFR